MMNDTIDLRLSVQYRLTSQMQLGPTREDRRSIIDEFEDQLFIHFMPSIITKRSTRSVGAFEPADLFIFLIGITFIGLIKDLVKGALNAAGHDAYAALKKLIIRLIKSQTERSYTANLSVFFVIEIGDDYAAIPILSRIFSKVDADYKDFDLIIGGLIDEKMDDLRSNIVEISKQIDQFSIGNTVDSMKTHGSGEFVHVLRYNHEKNNYYFYPVSSNEFFSPHSEL